MNRVFLVGFMGVGKTSVGKRIANKLNYKFVDCDAEIEQNTQMSIAKIFATKGEAYFRSLEKDLIQSYFDQEKIVVSTGGGLPCFNNLMTDLLNNGCVVNLFLDTPILVKRLQESKTVRPLIQGKNEEELFEYINETLAFRNQFYEKAHLTFNTKNLNAEKMDELVNEILKR